MITRVRDRLAGPVFWVLGVVLVLVLVLGVGRLVPQEPSIAIGVAVAVLMLGLTLADPTIIPLLAVPALLVVARVRLGGAEISVSDVVLFLAFWPAVALGPTALQSGAALPALAGDPVPGRNAVHRGQQPLLRERRRVVPRRDS